jgi:hypothetical protein
MSWMTLGVAGLLVLTPLVSGQSILNTNLIVNGNAEAGNAGMPTAVVASIPGWTRNGNANVLAYGLTNYILLTSPAPPDDQFQYFYAGDAGAGASTLTQTIDVSAGSATISAGNITFIGSAYLGGTSGGRTAGVTLAFQNSKSQTFSTATLGPISDPGPVGMTLQQSIGLVPPGTTQITVTLAFNGAYAAADSLSLVLSNSPPVALGANLLVNPGAEVGPSAPPPGLPLYIPEWSTYGDISVAPYGGTGWIAPTDPGPSNRGVNLFCKATPGTAAMYQDLDVTAQASLIDAGKGNYQVAAYLGGLAGTNSPTLVYQFFDWSGNQLAATANLGPVNRSTTGLQLVSHSGVLPAGTRRVHIELDYFGGTDDGMADEISFLVGNAAAPLISPGGIVPVYSSASTIEPGSWISIYGSGLAATTATWAGDFPTTLGGATVTINSKAAYIWFASPTQLNVQAPDDTAAGSVPVVVTTAAGSITSTVTLSQYAPSFSLFNGKYAAAIVRRPTRPATAGTGTITSDRQTRSRFRAVP